jgi:hypothetical protein
MLDDPIFGQPPQAVSTQAVEVVGRALESLGHHVDHAWPSGLRYLFAPIAAEISPRLA